MCCNAASLVIDGTTLAIARIPGNVEDIFLD